MMLLVVWVVDDVWCWLLKVGSGVGHRVVAAELLSNGAGGSVVAV